MVTVVYSPVQLPLIEFVESDDLSLQDEPLPSGSTSFDRSITGSSNPRQLGTTSNCCSSTSDIPNSETSVAKTRPRRTQKKFHREKVPGAVPRGIGSPGIALYTVGIVGASILRGPGWLAYAYWRIFTGAARPLKRPGLPACCIAKLKILVFSRGI